MDFQYQVGEAVKVVRLERAGELVRATIDGRVVEVRVLRHVAGEVHFSIEGERHIAYFATQGSTHFVAIDGDVFELKRPDPQRARRKHHQGEDSLSASMPGQIAQVLVNAGEAVRRGQPLIVLEAMKMEMKIAAPHDGRVAKVLVKPGQVVERGQRLIEMINDQ